MKSDFCRIITITSMTYSCSVPCIGDGAVMNGFAWHEQKRTFGRAGAVGIAFAIVLSSCYVKAQAPSLVPFEMNHQKAVGLHSPVDVSFLLDAPAGKHGFIKVQSGHLAMGDGQRIRFWGVNITDWSPGSRQVPRKQDAALWAETLARFGVNCVRFQFLDLEVPRGLIAKGDTTRSFDAEQFDREDNFIAELEKRGIYIDFNLLVGRPFKAGDGVADASLLREGAKGTSLFDKRMIELEKEYAQQLLAHKNPYTGLKYTDDPAVALVEINNENALNIGFKPPSPFYGHELEEMYNQWLKAHRSPQQIAALRVMAGVKDAQVAVPMLASRGAAAQAPPDRFYAEAEFFNDVQRDYFSEMEQYLKQTLGMRSLVIATADHSHTSSGYPILMAQMGMDVIDGHTYWQHPEMYVRKSPMVNDPFNSTVVELSRSAVAGKPYTVSEVNNPFPNDYGSEGIPVLAAYGALQDWDAILWYTFEPKADASWKPYVGDAFDISLDPVKMPQLAAGALLFLRGDVDHASAIVDRSYTQKQVFDSLLIPTTERPYYTPGFPLDLPLQHEVRISSFDGPATQTFPHAPVPDPIISDTRQLAWYHSAVKGGLVTVDSPRTQALIGFVRANGRSVSNLAAKVDNTFAAIQLSSLDAQPIAHAEKLLLVAGSTVENSGQQWNTAGTDVTNWGGSPALIEPVRGSIVLRGLAGAHAVHLQPLDGAGQPFGEAEDARKDGGDWVIELGKTVTTWYEITVER